MASILKVNTIQDATNSNTAMTLSSGGVVDMPKQENRYELIKAYNSQSNSSLGAISGSSTSAHINFAGVFASHYISYKLIIGWLNYAHSSNHSVNIRFLTGTNSEITNASYRWGIHRIEDDQTSYTANQIHQMIEHKYLDKQVLVRMKRMLDFIGKHFIM